jgi:hypothetical protein
MERRRTAASVLSASASSRPHSAPLAGLALPAAYGREIGGDDGGRSLRPRSHTGRAVWLDAVEEVPHNSRHAITLVAIELCEVMREKPLHPRPARPKALAKSQPDRAAEGERH